MRHSFPQFFLFKNKLSYYEKGTKWTNLFFVFFSKIQNTFFDFDKSQIFSNFNEVIRFINTQEGKHFFKIFDRKPQHTCICFINNLQKKY